MFDQLFFRSIFFRPKKYFRPKIIIDNFLFRFFVDEKESDRIFWLPHALQVGGTWIRKNPLLKMCLLKNIIIYRVCAAETIFSIDY